MIDAMAKTEDVIKKAESLGADEVVASTVFGKYRQVRFSNNQIDITTAWNDYATGVVLAWKKRVVATQIHDFRESDASLKQLMKLVKVSEENPTFGGFAKGTFRYAKSRADKRIEDIENQTDYVFGAIEAAKKEAGSKVQSGGILFAKFENVCLASSEGPSGVDTRSAIELSIRAFSQREASGHGVECSSTLRDFEPSRAGAKAGEIAKMAKNPSLGEEGVYDVVFDPLIFGSLLGVWARMASAYSIMTRTSIFVDKLGKNVAPEIVTLKDNPAPYSLSNRVFDDEGVPTRENVVIDHGSFKTYLHNASTAKIFKTKTTGSAGLIAPTPWNVEMEAGDASREELLKEMKRGLYLTNTWYSRFQNSVKGDFSTIPRDGIFLVERGEIKRSLKDLRISDNALAMLGNISCVSKERKHVHWWEEADPPSLSPYVLMKNVHITKSK
jgi:PmbA protein